MRWNWPQRLLPNPEGREAPGSGVCSQEVTLWPSASARCEAGGEGQLQTPSLWRPGPLGEVEGLPGSAKVRGGC